MGYLVAFVLFFVAVYINKRKVWYAPDVLFCYMWAAISYMSSLHLYGMYKSSAFVYIIVLVGSMSFVFGVSLSSKMSINKVSGVYKTTQDFIPKKFFWICVLLLFLLRLDPFLKSLALQMSGVDLQTMRHSFFEQSHSAKDVLISTVVSLLKPLLEIAGVVYFVRDIRHNFAYMIAVVILAMMESTINGGRFGLAFLIIELTVCYSIFSKRPSLSPKSLKKYKVKILAYVSILVAAIIVVTLLRGTEVSEMSIKYYRYFCGNIIFFDLHIDKLQKLPLYPFCTGLWGFWSQIFPLMHALFGFSYPAWYLDARDKIMNTQDFYQIGDDLYTNAFSTPFYYLYADMRMIGVILGMIVFGLIAGKAYRKMKANTCNKYLILYILVCQMIFMTVYFYPLTNTGYVLILLYYLYHNKVIESKR